MSDFRALANISQTYPTWQGGDLFFLERSGVAGKTTFSEFQSQDFTLSGTVNVTGTFQIGGATVSAAQWGYLGGATAFGGALLDDADAAAGRTTLGLGTAATLDAGTGANNLVQLDGSSRLPAVDGSQLTGLVSGFQYGWHPYNRTTADGTETGLVYDRSTDGAQKIITLPNFESGYDYRIYVREARATNNSCSLQVQIFGESDNAYLGWSTIQGMDSIGDESSFILDIEQPKTGPVRWISAEGRSWRVDEATTQNFPILGDATYQTYRNAQVQIFRVSGSFDFSQCEIFLFRRLATGWPT